MEFDLTPEQEQFRGVVREFAEAEIAPHAEAWDRDHTFPVDTVLAMGKLGLFGLPFPEEYGGGGADYLTYCIAIEELARVDSSMAITLEAGVSLGAAPFFYSGHRGAEAGVPRADDRGRGARRVRAHRGRGRLRRGRHAHPRHARRRRARVGDRRPEDVHHQLGHADHEVRHDHRAHRRRTRSRTSSSTRARRASPCMPPYRKMGWHASDTHELVFDGCRVPEDHLLGVRGEGFKTFLRILDDGRIAIAALAVGLAQACLDASVAYAKERQAFGGPIGRYQSIAFKCADMAVAVENARNLTYKAAWLREQGRPIRRRGGDGEALLERDRRERDARGRADPRRLRLHRRDAGEPLLPRREDPRDR